ATASRAFPRATSRAVPLSARVRVAAASCALPPSCLDGASPRAMSPQLSTRAAARPARRAFARGARRPLLRACALPMLALPRRRGRNPCARADVAHRRSRGAAGLPVAQAPEDLPAQATRRAQRSGTRGGGWKAVNAYGRINGESQRIVDTIRRLADETRCNGL